MANSVKITVKGTIYYNIQTHEYVEDPNAVEINDRGHFTTGDQGTITRDNNDGTYSIMIQDAPNHGTGVFNVPGDKFTYN